MPSNYSRFTAITVALIVSACSGCYAQMLCAAIKDATGRSIVRQSIEAVLPMPNRVAAWRLRWVQNASTDFPYECFQVVRFPASASSGNISTLWPEGSVDGDVHSTLAADPIRLIDGSDQIRVIDPSNQRALLAVTIVNRQYNLDVVTALGVVLGVVLLAAVIVVVCCCWSRRRSTKRASSFGRLDGLPSRSSRYAAGSAPPTSLGEGGEDDGCDDRDDGFGGVSATAVLDRPREAASYLASEASWSDTAAGFGLSPSVVQQLTKLGVKSRTDLVDLLQSPSALSTLDCDPDDRRRLRQLALFCSSSGPEDTAVDVTGHRNGAGSR